MTAKRRKCEKMKRALLWVVWLSASLAQLSGSSLPQQLSSGSSLGT